MPMYKKRISICEREKNHHRRVSLIIIWKPLKGVVQKVSLISQQHQRAEAPRVAADSNCEMIYPSGREREKLICLNCVSFTFVSLLEVQSIHECVTGYCFLCGMVFAGIPPTVWTQRTMMVKYAFEN